MENHYGIVIIKKNEEIGTMALELRVSFTELFFFFRNHWYSKWESRLIYKFPFRGDFSVWPVFGVGKIKEDLSHCTELGTFQKRGLEYNAIMMYLKALES